MARVTRAASHLSAEEVKRRLKYDPRPWCRGRWLIIYNATLRAQESGGDCQALWRVKGHGASSDLHLQSLRGRGNRDAWQGRPSAPVFDLLQKRRSFLPPCLRKPRAERLPRWARSNAPMKPKSDMRSMRARSIASSIVTAGES